MYRTANFPVGGKLVERIIRIRADDKAGTAIIRRARLMPLGIPYSQPALPGNRRRGIGPGPQRPLRMAIAISALASNRNAAIGPVLWVPAWARPGKGERAPGVDRNSAGGVTSWIRYTVSIMYQERRPSRCQPGIRQDVLPQSGTHYPSAGSLATGYRKPSDNDS